MKRDRFTIADVYGLESEDQLKEYNKWLLHPQRPIGVSAKKFRAEEEERSYEKKRKKDDSTRRARKSGNSY